jgi:hypothetical protein
VTLAPTSGYRDYVIVRTPRGVTGEKYGVDRTYSLPFSFARNTTRLALIGAPRDAPVGMG